MSNVLMLSAIVMLVLLFFKVPVFIAVLGGSMVYFVMNPGINTVIRLCRYLHELHRCYKEDHGFL